MSTQPKPTTPNDIFGAMPDFPGEIEKGDSMDEKEKRSLREVNNEWTVESSETSGWYIAFDKSNGVFIDNELTAKGIADAHNAAITAERKKQR